jgi:hypothetical protein
VAENRAFKAVMRSDEHIASPPRATQLSAGENAGVPACHADVLRPSQVPVPGTVAGPGVRQAGMLARRVPALRPSQVPVPGGTSAAGPGVREALSQPGEPLEDGVRSWMEDRFESDFSDVRICRGPGAAASARTLGADAYTVGNRIVLASGQYDLGSVGGKRLLAHELAHVVQQRSGSVSGLPIGGDVTVSQPEDCFEEAAENKARQIMAWPGTPRAAWAADPADGKVAETSEGRQHFAGASTKATPGPALSVQRAGPWSWRGPLLHTVKVGTQLSGIAAALANFMPAYTAYQASPDDPVAQSNYAVAVTWLGSAIYPTLESGYQAYQEFAKWRQEPTAYKGQGGSGEPTMKEPPSTRGSFGPDLEPGLVPESESEVPTESMSESEIPTESMSERESEDPAESMSEAAFATDPVRLLFRQVNELHQRIERLERR